MESKFPWREAGPPNHHDDKVDSDQQVVNNEIYLSGFLVGSHRIQRERGRYRERGRATERERTKDQKKEEGGEVAEGGVIEGVGFGAEGMDLGIHPESPLPQPTGMEWSQ